MIKKNSLIVIILLLNLYASAQDDTNKQKIILNQAIALYNNKINELGRDRLFTIMYEGDHGINSFNKNITYALSNNLSQDLVIPRIGLYFSAKTDMGQTFLIDTLSKPISPKDKSGTIKLRSQIIKNLIHDILFKKEIDLILDQVKSIESDAMSLMIDRDSALEKIKAIDRSKEYGVFAPFTKPWYILQQYEAQNPWANTYKQVNSILNAAFIGSISAAQAYDAYQTVRKPDFKLTNPDQMMINDISNHILMDYINPFNPTTIQPEHLNLALSSKYNQLTDSKYSTISADAKNASSSAIGSIVTGLSAYFIGKSVYDTHQEGLAKRNLIYALQQIVSAAKKIEKLCQDRGLTTQFHPNLITNKAGLAMIKGIEHPRYSEKESSLVATPWVNTFVNEIYEHDMNLAPIFALIAEMDTYNAIAQKMIETKKSPNQFCFAQTLDKNKTTIKSENFWNIIINNSTTNSLDEDRSIIFTGANAGGKSTAMRSILQNIVLAQTFGIATGTLYHYTPYDYLDSFLHIVDDPEQNLSRYASELKNANKIVHRAKTLRPDEKYFFIIDELFTGTGGKEGQTLAFEFINEDLAPYLDRTQFVFATHFDKLKEIEATNPQKFANYKINPPTFNSQGKLQYPFTISKGANDVNIAGLLKKEAGLLGKAQ